MGRKSEPGIIFYRTHCSHIHEKETRLLMMDVGPVGYWVYHCLQSVAYAKMGYYFDLNNQEDLELFALDICKQPLDIVESTVKSTIKRGIFDSDMYDNYGILTCAEMQDHYIFSTGDRRRKGTVIDLISDYLLIKIEEKERNIRIVPRNNSIDPRPSTYSKSNSKSRGDTTVSLTGSDEPGQDTKFQQDCYKELVKDLATISGFIKETRPTFIEPYRDLWNLFAGKYKVPTVSVINKDRRKKFAIRIQDKNFDLLAVLAKAKVSQFLLSGNWFNFDWLLTNESNYLKVLEGYYDNKNLETLKANESGQSEAAKNLRAKITGAADEAYQ